MRSFGLKKLGISAALGLAFVAGGTLTANAQYPRYDDRDRERIERDQRRAEREMRQRQRARRQTRDSRYNDSRRYSSNAVDMGYQQGFLAGQSDRSRGKYGRSNVYRNTGSYPNAGDPSSADYLYRQGYLQGYDDGYYGRRRY